jgi:triacylglycerol lipase
MTPIVLAHGFLGVGDVKVGPARFSYFHRIDRAIAARGHPLIVPRVHPTGTIARRAGELKQQILDGLARIGRPDARVAIFAHSMGGLDARYMISRLAMADRVAALVTIATPHRGSSFADYGLRTVERRFRPLAILQHLGLDTGAVRDLTCASAVRFNETVLDHPDVRYFSVGTWQTWQRTAVFLLPSHRVIAAAEGDNDGLVSLKSAAWGESLGTWQVDHLHVINKRFTPRGLLAGDIAPRYLALLDELTARGVLPAPATEAVTSAS